MRAGRLAGAVLAASTMVAQPCLAAEDVRDAGSGQRQSSAFAGAVLRVPLGTARPAAPAARLQLGVRHRFRDGRGGSPDADLRPALFELGATRRGRAAFYVGGRDVAAAAERRLGMKGDTGWLVPALIIGAVVVGVVLMTGEGDPAPAAPAP